MILNITTLWNGNVICNWTSHGDHMGSVYLVWNDSEINGKSIEHEESEAWKAKTSAEMFPICRSLRVMSWRHRGFTWKPRSSLTKEKMPMKLASGFCIPEPLGDLRVTVRASPHPRTSYSSRSEHPVWFPGDFAGLSHGAPSISFGAPSQITASGDGLTSSEDEGAVGLPPSGVVTTAALDPELMAMLARTAVSIGLEVNRPPSPEPSRLDDWFLRAGRGSQPCSVPVPFLPGGAWGAGEIMDGPFHDQKPLVRLLRPHYPRRRGCQGVRGHSPGGESGRGAPVPAKRHHLEEPSASPVQGL